MTIIERRPIGDLFTRSVDGDRDLIIRASADNVRLVRQIALTPSDDSATAERLYRLLVAGVMLDITQGTDDENVDSFVNRELVPVHTNIAFGGIVAPGKCLRVRNQAYAVGTALGRSRDKRLRKMGKVIRLYGECLVEPWYLDGGRVIETTYPVELAERLPEYLHSYVATAGAEQLMV